MKFRDVRVTKLLNGLDVVAEIIPEARSSALGFFVKTGSQDEQVEEAGISHFLEHLLFKGTEKRKALEITYELGSLGAQANAYTSEEQTVLYAATLPEVLPRVLEVLADMISPNFPIEEVEIERKVVLEEIAQYLDRPQSYLADRALRDYFGDDPAGRPVLGSAESVSNLTRDMVSNYHARRYVASNMVLIASGKVDWEKFLEDASKYCSELSSSSVERKTRAITHKPEFKEYKKENLHQYHLLFLCPGPSAYEDERYAMLILESMLGDGVGSRMYWELVEPGIAEIAVLEGDERDSLGCINAYAGCNKDRVNEVSDKMHNIMKRASEFSDDELFRAKKRIMARLIHSVELPLGRLLGIGTDWLYYHRVISLDEHMDKIKNISHDDILNALQKFPLNDVSEFRLVAGRESKK